MERGLVQRLAVAIEHTIEAVVVTNVDGVIEYVNPAFERITGYESAEVLGRNISLLKSGVHDEGFYAALWRTIADGGVFQGRFVNRRKDGTLYEEEGSIAPVRDEAGEVVGFVSVKRDISADIELHRQVQQAQKMEAVGRLAAGVAHDFNNVLATILVSTEFLLRDLEVDGPSYSDVSEIQRSAQQGRALVKQLLAFARRREPMRSRVELNELIARLGMMLRRIVGRSIVLATDVSDDVLEVLADPVQLEQVILNLGINARDAMPDGGRLHVAASRAVAEAVPCSGCADAPAGMESRVHLRITDTGVGMSAETLARIFEPFFTTKPPGQGTGLGLSTAHSIVASFGGVVIATSAPDAGTTMRICLPLAD